MESDGDAISTATPTFSATPDSDMPLTTRPDVGRHRELECRRRKPEVEITFERKVMATRFQRLPHIFDHARLRHGTADVEIALFSFFVPKLFLLPVWVAAISCSRCRPTSGHVDGDTTESGKVENVGVAVKIASSSLSVKKLFPLPVCVAAILSSDVGRCRSMPPDVGPCWQCQI